MSKLFLFIAMLCVSLCTVCVHAQNTGRRVVTIEEMFSIADRQCEGIAAVFHDDRGSNPECENR